MRFQLSDDQQFLVDTTRRFLAKEMPSVTMRTWLRGAGGDKYRRWWTACSALGWSGIFAPESVADYGSVSGEPIVDAAILAELAGAALAPSALIGSSVAVAAVGSATSVGGADLSSILDGSCIASFALTEPSTSFDVDAVETAARRVGGDLLVSGVKTNVPDAATADLFVVACRVDDSVALIPIPRDAPGVTVVPRCSIDLLREFGDVRLDGVRVPAAAVLSPEDGATTLARSAVRLALGLQLAESVGAVDHLAGMLLDYARERYAFGRPIGAFQAIKHRIADMTLWAESCKATVDTAVNALSHNDSDADLLLSTAKSYVGDRSIRIAQECTQMFGGIGLTWEHDAHLYLRRLTANRALLGTPEQHRSNIARILGFREAVAGRNDK
jgi:alkylation response protein AidB-like acyl-CoA dehydrogenase